MLKIRTVCARYNYVIMLKFITVLKSISNTVYAIVHK